ncbi:MAG: hypothetical protein AABX05_02570, partial [Nanoarchaeota archaeon]
MLSLKKSYNHQKNISNGKKRLLLIFIVAIISFSLLVGVYYFGSLNVGQALSQGYSAQKQIQICKPYYLYCDPLDKVSFVKCNKYGTGFYGLPGDWGECPNGYSCSINNSLGVGQVGELNSPNDQIYGCKIMCGDGLKGGDEECDDGNTNNNDFCSSACKFNTTYLSKPANLKVLIVRTCDSDGSKCTSVFSATDLSNALKSASDVYKRGGSNFNFVLDPRSNLDTPIHDTLLNSDCLQKVAIPETVIEQDVNNDNKINEEDQKAICDWTLPVKARTAYALQYPNSIVVFARGNPIYAKYNTSDEHWEIRKATGGSSACGASYINMPGWTISGNLFAHESGHYFCTPHTFADNPKTVADAAATIKNYIINYNINPDSAEKVVKIFDGDRRFSIDTPADPGVPLFISVYGGNGCDPDLNKKINVPVTLNTGTKTYTFHQDRTNIMSYFKGCFPSLAHFSEGQVRSHQQTLYTLRTSLIYVNLRNFATLSSCYQQKSGLKSSESITANRIISAGDATSSNELSKELDDNIRQR